MKNNYLIVNESTDPAYNLALEEYLLLHFTEGRIVMLWQNDNAIIIGRHQNLPEEIDQDYIKEQGIKVVRRTTGGGAVYHDLGNLNYSFIADYEPGGSMQEFADVAVEALRSLGVRAEFGGKNDILIDGKKISGTAQRICGNRMLYHGCLLFDSDLSRLDRSLRVRPEKYSSRAVKSVRSRVGNLKDYLGEDMGLLQLKECLVKAFLQDGKYQILHTKDLVKNKQHEIQKLKHDKYESWEWNYGASMKYTAHNCKRFDGGTVEAYMDIGGGKIEKCRICGDFMALRPVEEIADGLVGTRYRYEDVLEVLKHFPLFDYFGTIGGHEVASVICL